MGALAAAVPSGAGTGERPVASVLDDGDGSIADTLVVLSVSRMVGKQSTSAGTSTTTTDDEVKAAALLLLSAAAPTLLLSLSDAPMELFNDCCCINDRGIPACCPGATDDKEEGEGAWSLLPACDVSGCPNCEGAVGTPSTLAALLLVLLRPLSKLDFLEPAAVLTTITGGAGIAPAPPPIHAEAEAAELATALLLLLLLAFPLGAVNAGSLLLWRELVDTLPPRERLMLALAFLIMDSSVGTGFSYRMRAAAPRATTVWPCGV